jgi:hypothetical protein
MIGDAELVAFVASAESADPLRYDGLEQDAQGAWTSPAAARMAWFPDPDGNTLSLTERS